MVGGRRSKVNSRLAMGPWGLWATINRQRHVRLEVVGSTHRLFIAYFYIAHAYLDEQILSLFGVQYTIRIRRLFSITCRHKNCKISFLSRE